MGSYVESNLINNESIKYEGKVSIWSLFPNFLIGLVLLPFYGFGLLFWLPALVKYFTTELAITDKRVIAKFGFIRRSTVELSLDRTESIQVEQGIIGRVFNFGSIVVGGAGNAQAPIPGISQPMIFRNEFLKIQEDNKLT
ncbi:PH domain-containing protein [Vibrio lentus]